MPRKNNSTPEDTVELMRRREDAFRPARFLGYNHNSLAVHLIERGAYPIAEAELRRAIWLNPFEPIFMANLAWCLHKLGRDDDAREHLLKAIEQDPDNTQTQKIGAFLGITIESKESGGPDGISH